jgi:hypothetical protein
VLEPAGPTEPIQARMMPEPTAAYGRYLAHSVANCVGCHTRRDMKTGAYIGESFAGGNEMESHTLAGMKFAPPNLTPHAATGRISSWTEDAFVARFRAGQAIAGTPMPWRTFQIMSDTDLRALYRYLRTVPAVQNDTGPAVRASASGAQAARD